MRILLAHEHYRSGAPSGEDAVFRNERALLESNQVEVIPFERFNDAIDDSTLSKRIGVALSAAWSNRTYEEVRRVVRKHRPHLAHFHNTFPVISPSAYAACQDERVPVVQTLHNYRLICPGALLMRAGRPCEDCVGTNLLPALRHRCYRSSLPASSAVVWMLSLNRSRGVYRTLVDRYIALTAFAAGRLVAGGLPKSRIEVKPNFLPVPPAPGSGGGGYAVYVGRLSPEKGVRTLLNAWKRINGLPLKILGDGPLRYELEERARRDRLAVEFLGFHPHSRVLAIVSEAALQVIPSECYEGFPMVVLEALACGTPVVAARIGSLEEIVVEGESGIKFDPGNAADLASKVAQMHADPLGQPAMRGKARALFEQKYTSGRNYLRLLEIYEHAQDEAKRRRKG